MKFSVPTAFPNLALASVAAHGLTDWTSGKHLRTYVLMVLPLPGAFITSTFLALSFFHFAGDVGLLGTTALHGFIAYNYAWGSQQRALNALLGYMTLVHVPAHYSRVAQTKDAFASLGATAAATVALAIKAPWKGVMPIDHMVQRLVICHILCDMSRRLEGTHWQALLLGPSHDLVAM
jgi:hypothetical protein